MRRLFVCFLSLLLVISLSVPIAAGADETVIIAGSDFQHPEGNEVGAEVMSDIVSAIKNDGVSAADGFLFCGDYDYDTYGDAKSVSAGVRCVKDTVKGMVGAENIILAQGNHDTAAGSCGMTPGGENDPESKAYGVFVINNDDYMWKNTDEDKVADTARQLKIYLDRKLSEKFKQPIFIVSHLALHYSMRTTNDGDGMYAKYLFDVINSAADKGLNIVFLYGHDHSNGWDDYLGGSSVFLKKGDEILIGQNSKTEYKSEILSFTYMNAGFVSYYNNHNGADDALTMTVFKIKSNEMTVSRYSADGLHPLKSKGVTNAYKNETGYLPDLTEYSSPQKIVLCENESINNEIDDDGKEKPNDYTIPIIITVSALLITAFLLIVFINKKKA